MLENAHKVVIIGGGAGGLELAAKLGRQFGPAHVVLVDKSAYHIWKPSLHEVAAGTLDIHREGLSYAMLAKDCGFTYVHGEVTQIDREARTIEIKALDDEKGVQLLPGRSLAYNTLVMAVGSKCNFFNTPGAAEFAVALDSTSQAESFRLRLLRALMTADQIKAANADHKVHIAIVGGGATGVELAAELTEACVDIAYYGLTHLDPRKDVCITILEGAPRILAPLPEKLSIAAHELLSQRGVTIKTKVRVASVAESDVSDTEGNRYPADLCVWAAGIEAPAFLAGLGLPVNRINQLIVDSGMRSEDPDIFAFGDCAQVKWFDDKFLPARAQVAHQQATFLCKALSARIKGEPVPTRAFEFHDHGSLVSVGQNQGVGSLMGVLLGKSLFVEGLIARLMYMSLHLMHHMAFLGAVRTSMLAIGRLFLRRSAPRVKLH
jgi:NADH dehydrogenase